MEIQGMKVTTADNVSRVYSGSLSEASDRIKWLGEEGYVFMANNYKTMRESNKWSPYKLVLVARSSRKNPSFLWAIKKK